jgi:hypothetical protein
VLRCGDILYWQFHLLKRFTLFFVFEYLLVHAVLQFRPTLMATVDTYSAGIKQGPEHNIVIVAMPEKGVDPGRGSNQGSN